MLGHVYTRMCMGMIKIDTHTYTQQLSLQVLPISLVWLLLMMLTSAADAGLSATSLAHV